MARGVNTKANGIDFRANRFDEFLKLIPQNLTDAEKAQVMANLGITPTPGSLDGAVRYDAAQTLTDEQKQQVQENAGVDEALAEKANNDGYYSKMTVGVAESLVGGNETSREFAEDTAGGTADIADGIVQIEKIKGNTIVFNQGYYELLNAWVVSGGTKTMLEHGVRVSSDAATTLSIGTRPSANAVKNNKYLLIYDFETDGTLPNKVEFNGVFETYFGPHTGVNKIIKIAYNGNNPLIGGISATNATYFEIKNVCHINLTLMFGAGNEPATVAEFEKMFPLYYYNYNARKLLSLNPTAIKTVGFNAYNHTTGKAYVIGGKQYQITGAYTSIAEGDTAITPDEDGLFTPTKNGDLTIEGGNSTTTCVHLVWSGVRNGEFEEHWEETRNIPAAQINTDGTITESAAGKTRLFPDGLCSAGDVHDEITTTKAVKRILNFNLGNLQWSYNGNGHYLTATLSGAYYNITWSNVPQNTISSKYIAATPNEASGTIGDKNNVYSIRYSTVYVRDSNIVSSDIVGGYCSKLDGVYLSCKKETPIEVTFAEPLNLTYRVSDFGTETLLPINTATPVTTPIRLDVVYGLNVVDFVRNADKNYLTIEDSTGDNGSSFTNLRSALSTAFGIDIVPTYDSTNKRYTFAISDNRKVEVPESATSSGTKGTWAEDSTSVYFCTDTDTWVKINKETW